ncbi:MAG TPA: imidazole glycerol phosphate synthase subunit HisH [Chitinophagaceae bacterium]|nr:imidazole glycerol phosphate synthase subunit HisH [Chitinophagaceae bacterium]
MAKEVLIVDYGMGNLFSIRKVAERLGYQCTISHSPEEIRRAAKLILPGVGHFGKAMQNLEQTGLIEVLHEAVLVKKTPVLGICLGMQLMASFSEEGDARGLGWFDARVERFRITNTDLYKVPHMGWNTLTHEKPASPLLQGITTADEFYFVHSYHITTNIAEDALTKTPYEYLFVSSIEKANIFGVQFHPEKSHTAGEKMLRNFLNLT